MGVRSVGASEAKTHLPILLDEVARGGTVVITKHGVPVARLVPVSADVRATEEVIEELRRFRRENMLGGLSLRDLIETGRQ